MKRPNKLGRAILAGEFDDIVDDEGEGVVAAEGSQSRLWSFPESQLTSQDAAADGLLKGEYE